MAEEKTNDLFNSLNNVDSVESLGGYLRSIDGISDVSLTDHLKSLLNEKGIGIPEVSELGCIERTYCYQIFNGRKNPGRDKLIAIAIAMKLTLEETQRLLEVARVGILYAKNTRDAVIMYAIKNKESIMTTNSLLKQYNKPELV